MSNTVTTGMIAEVYRYFDGSELCDLERWLEAAHAEYKAYSLECGGDECAECGGAGCHGADIRIGYNFPASRRSAGSGLFMFSGDVAFDGHHCDVCISADIRDLDNTTKFACELLMELAAEIDTMRSEVGK